MSGNWQILSLLIWLPMVGGIGILLVGQQRAALARFLTLIVSIATFVASIMLVPAFDYGTASMQFVERSPWIETFNVFYHLGVDGFSVPLIILTTFTTVLVVLAGWDVITRRVSQYFGAFLVLESLMIGVFCAQDALLFYIFFEAMLVPMFLIIGMWGGPRRVYATIKFFLYTFLGSVFMLIGLIYLYLEGGSFAIADFQAMALTAEQQFWLFLAFLAAFSVKIPMWPVHTWLPDAHVEAPTGGSVILAAVMLKIGGYGFIRFSLPVTPDASADLAWLVIAMSLIAVVYIGFVALAQSDMKKLIAYSSISHMGFVTLGLFVTFAIMKNTGNADSAALGIQGAMIQMISHGFISGAMFLCVGVLYDRMHSRNIEDYGGVVNTMPWFAALFVLFAMANAGLPGTSGFVGEFTVILASFQANFWYAFAGATTLILGAAYTLWMVKRVIFGDVANDNVAALKDIGRREAFILVSLALAVLALGIQPKPLTDMLDASVVHLVQQVMQSKTG